MGLLYFKKWNFKAQAQKKKEIPPPPPPPPQKKNSYISGNGTLLYPPKKT